MRSRNPLRLLPCLVVAFACLTASTSPALAQTAQVHGYGIRVQGSCPSAAQVNAAVDFVLGPGTALDGSAPGHVLLEVIDLGPGYRVSLGSTSPADGASPQSIQSREYADPGRGCEERARVAAVYAVVTGEPPDVLAQQLPRAIAPPPRPPLRFSLIVGPMVATAVRSSDSFVTWGAELRAVVSGPRLGGTLGVGATAPALGRWGRDQVQITRIPMDASARYALRYGAVELSGEAGLALAVLRLKGNLGMLDAEGVNADALRLDVGARLAVAVRLVTRTRWSPVLALHGAVNPRPYTIVVQPPREIGDTPLLWVGATLGIEAGLR